MLEIAAFCRLPTFKALFRSGRLILRRTSRSEKENEPVDIASGAAQSFVFATSLPEVSDIVVGPIFTCDRYWYDGRSSSVSSLALSVEDEPVSDIISIALTTTGDGIVRRSPNGVGAFSVAAINIVV
ncbi:hypothetical protein HXX25_06535 [Hyphobacterium sp. CCMP332]|uniref:hypothetical protein n=1 Tax=Hyphobacterium sp. CCMP332 TaxID=2749086 RepID=UPI0016502442|nr:hypothetical protein [Hyphobacterium sp. CCMP332]QNL19014.1 hypothetical protein HXX25_06535 [Hyphobacterium sp. CCMP332]